MAEGDFSAFEPGCFDLVLSPFAFDNIPARPNGVSSYAAWFVGYPEVVSDAALDVRSQVTVKGALIVGVRSPLHSRPVLGVNACLQLLPSLLNDNG